MWVLEDSERKPEHESTKKDPAQGTHLHGTEALEAQGINIRGRREEQKGTANLECYYLTQKENSSILNIVRLQFTIADPLKPFLLFHPTSNIPSP